MEIFDRGSTKVILVDSDNVVVNVEDIRLQMMWK